MTNSTPHKVLKSIAWGKMTFGERVVLHRVDRDPSDLKSDSIRGGRSTSSQGTEKFDLTLHVGRRQLTSRRGDTRLPTATATRFRVKPCFSCAVIPTTSRQFLAISSSNQGTGKSDMTLHVGRRRLTSRRGDTLRPAAQAARFRIKTSF